MKDSTTGLWEAYAKQEQVTCDWTMLSMQLLNQWKELTRQDLECTDHSRYAIAKLVERKHGINARLVENYLCNVERTLPLLQC